MLTKIMERKDRKTQGKEESERTTNTGHTRLEVIIKKKLSKLDLN